MDRVIEAVAFGLLNLYALKSENFSTFCARNECRAVKRHGEII